MNPCMIKTSSVLPWKSSVTFKNCSETVAIVWPSDKLRTTVAESSENVRKSSENRQKGQH